MMTFHTRILYLSVLIWLLILEIQPHYYFLHHHHDPHNIINIAHSASSSSSSSFFVHAKFGWSNCKYYPAYRINSCESLFIVPDYSLIPMRVFNKNSYAVFNTFYDTDEMDLCAVPELTDQFSTFQYYNASRFKSCEDFFCGERYVPMPKVSSYPMDVQTYVRLSEYTTLMNYCRYCEREDFESFHEKVTKGSCPDYYYPFGHCSKSLKDGYPLFTPRLMAIKNFSIPLMCHCQISSKTAFMAYKCDFFSFFTKPLIYDIFPMGMTITYLLLFVFAVLFILFPFLVIVVKQLFKTRENGGNGIGARIRRMFNCLMDTHLLITVALCVHFLLSAAEFLLWIPFEKLYLYRMVVGTGFFQILSFLALLMVLCTIFFVWINIIYRANSKEQTHSMALHLKIILGVIYLLIIAFSAIPFTSLGISSLKKSNGRRLEQIFVPTGLVIIGMLAMGIAIYAIRLWIRIKATIPHLNFFNLKLTKFAMVVTILLLLMCFQLIFLIIDITKETVFGHYYRSMNFQFLYFTVLLVDFACTFQTFSWEMVRLAFPFLNRFRRRKYSKKSSRKTPQLVVGTSLSLMPLLDAEEARIAQEMRSTN